MPEQRGGLGSLGNRTFRTLWASSVVSNTGTIVQVVGASWLMTSLTSSESMVALVQASYTLPMMLVSLAAGALADSRDRRHLMIAAQSFMLTTSLVLAALAAAGLLTPWLLLALIFLIGGGRAMHNPSWQASYSDIVDHDDLPSAVSMNAMGMNITRSVGPALGGLIVAILGAASAFAVAATSYVAIIAALLRWRPAQTTSRLPSERFSGAIAAGLRYFILSPHLINTDFRGAFYGFAAISMQALLPLVARDMLHGNAFVYGFLLGAFGLGAVVGALNSARFRARFSVEVIVRLGCVLFAVTCVIVAFSTSMILTAVTIFFAGACWINVMALLNVTVQMSTPRWVLGRMISLYFTWIFGGMALGSWAWGVVAQSHSLAAAFMGAAVVLLAVAAWGLRFPIEQYGSVNLEPLDRFREPTVKLDLNERSGPILIMVEYEIDQVDVTEFLEAIRDRRRIRIRDGAQRWELLRDIANPNIWKESYHFPTWTDYFRHNDRRTVADDAVIQRLAELHRGPHPLRVERLIARQTVETHDDTPPITIRPVPLP